LNPRRASLSRARRVTRSGRPSGVSSDGVELRSAVLEEITRLHKMLGIRDHDGPPCSYVAQLLDTHIRARK
jgi:hypothetical protein